MKKLVVAIGLLGGGALLATSARSRPYEQALVVSVSRDSDSCRVIVSGERVTSDRLVEIGRSARKRRAIVIYDKETPFKCVGDAISTLQRAGLTRIDAVIWDASGER
jgi:hypothetical protein